jgi:hypothetical protein
VSRAPLNEALGVMTRSADIAVSMTAAAVVYVGLFFACVPVQLVATEGQIYFVARAAYTYDRFAYRWWFDGLGSDNGIVRARGSLVIWSCHKLTRCSVIDTPHGAQL